VKILLKILEIENRKLKLKERNKEIKDFKVKILEEQKMFIDNFNEKKKKIYKNFKNFKNYF